MRPSRLAFASYRVPEKSGHGLRQSPALSAVQLKSGERNARANTLAI